jgi:hypothetical protein
MKRALICVCTAAAVLGVVVVAAQRLPREVELPVYEKPVEFFSEKKQAILIGKLPEGIGGMSAEACGSCHKQEYAEWKASAHSRSVTEPVFAAAFKAEPRFLCRSCHSPLEEQHPVLLTRIQGDPKVLVHGASLAHVDAFKPQVHGLELQQRGFITEKNPKYDPHLAKEGVTCVTCHVRDETVLTSNRRALNNVPHALSYAPEMKKADFCGGCHQFDVASPAAHPFEMKPFRPGPAARKRQHQAMMAVFQRAHRAQAALASEQSPPAPSPPPLPTPEDEEEPPVPPSPGMEHQYQQEARVQHTLDEFRISPAALRGETCQSCHMPKDNGRRAHTWPGRDSAAMLRKAVSMTVRLDKPSYQAGDRLQAVIKLKNDAGHRFPTGDSIHAGILDVWLRDGEKTLGRRVWVMSNQASGNQQVFFESFHPGAFPGPGNHRDKPGQLDAPSRIDTRLLPGEEATLVYRQAVGPAIAAAKDLKLRVRVFHSAVHPGFKHSSIDPGINTMRLIREENVPVAVRVLPKPGGREASGASDSGV